MSSTSTPVGNEMLERFLVSRTSEMQRALVHNVRSSGVRSAGTALAKPADIDVYVGRRTRDRQASTWQNPFRLVGTSTRARALCVSTFIDDLLTDDNRLDGLAELAGLRLGCWCAPQLCHGHALAVGATDPKALVGWANELRALADSLPRRLLVTGSRGWSDRAVMARTLHEQWTSWGRPVDAVLVVGDARGADAMAAELWAKAGLPVEVHRADWDGLGRRAGMVRNQAMIASGVDAALAFRVGDTPGTRGCIAAAERSGIPVGIIDGLASDSH